MRAGYAGLLLAFLMQTGTAYAGEKAVSLHYSLDGARIELTKSFFGRVNSRFGYHRYSSTDQYTGGLPIVGAISGETIYSESRKQQVLSVVADWYPEDDSQIRLSAGLMYNRVRSSLIGREGMWGGYTINGRSYTAGEVGQLTGEVRYNSVVPYLGIGWGNPLLPEKKWGFMADIGMMFRGEPDIRLSATGSAPSLNADLLGEQDRLRIFTKNWEMLASIAISYRW